MLFYIGFFALMWCVRASSAALLTPIAGISRMLGEIGLGRWRPEPLQAQIRELDEMSRHTQEPGASPSAGKRSGAWNWCWKAPPEPLGVRHGEPFAARTWRDGGALRLPSGQLSDSDFRQRIHPDDLPQALAQIERVREAAAALRGQVPLRRQHGRIPLAARRGRVLEHDPDTGAARVLAGTHVDIDALKRVEEELREATLQAQAASEAKGRLLSGISHELRTPLNAILGFAQLMRMDCDDEPGRGGRVPRRDPAGQPAPQSAAGEILEWSSLQNEPAQLELQPVNVCELMRECAELVSLDIQQRGLRLDLSLPDERLLVLAEPRRLRQVLLNLLSNAMKYNVPEGHISLRAETSPSHVRLLVEDTGLGIDPRSRRRCSSPSSGSDGRTA